MKSVLFTYQATTPIRSFHVIFGKTLGAIITAIKQSTASLVTLEKLKNFFQSFRDEREDFLEEECVYSLSTQTTYKCRIVSSCDDFFCQSWKFEAEFLG